MNYEFSEWLRENKSKRQQISRESLFAIYNYLVLHAGKVVTATHMSKSLYSLGCPISHSTITAYLKEFVEYGLFRKVEWFYLTKNYSHKKAEKISRNVTYYLNENVDFEAAYYEAKNFYSGSPMFNARHEQWYPYAKGMTDFYNALRAKGFSVTSGVVAKYKNQGGKVQKFTTKIDFVIEKGENQKAYFAVGYDRNTVLEQALLDICDNHPKYIVFPESYEEITPNGVRICSFDTAPHVLPFI
ncbi:MAG: hypothetical protein MJ132_08310 [Clostridia bacterium]|nr:hypothetical protein [Clostridia bacterium]